jgi:hypothetical protein
MVTVTNPKASQTMACIKQDSLDESDFCIKKELFKKALVVSY